MHDLGRTEVPLSTEASRVFFFLSSTDKPLISFFINLPDTKLIQRIFMTELNPILNLKKKKKILEFYQHGNTETRSEDAVKYSRTEPTTSITAL